MCVFTNLPIVYSLPSPQTKRKLERVPPSTQTPTKRMALSDARLSVVPKASTPAPVVRTVVFSRVRWRSAKRPGPNTVLYNGKLFRPKERARKTEVLSWGTVPGSKQDLHSSSVPLSERHGYPFKLDYVFAGFTSLIHIGPVSVKMTAVRVKSNNMQWRAKVMLCGLGSHEHCGSALGCVSSVSVSGCVTYGR